jgi:hypothetical protein
MTGQPTGRVSIMADETRARLDILETLHRYAWGYDTRDLERMGGAFAPDGIFEIALAGHPGWGPYRGREAIVAWLIDVMAGQSDQRRHCICNVSFRELKSARARVDSYLLLTAVENGALRLVCTGTYHDELIEENGAWLIKHKRLHLDNPF